MGTSQTKPGPLLPSFGKLDIRGGKLAFRKSRKFDSSWMNCLLILTQELNTQLRSQDLLDEPSHYQPRVPKGEMIVLAQAFLFSLFYSEGYLVLDHWHKRDSPENVVELNDSEDEHRYWRFPQEFSTCYTAARINAE